MTNSTKLTVYQSFLLVRGHVDAMLDMLRYDCCHPASEAESGRMERALAQQEEGLFILRRRAASAQPATLGRWRSFGCDVLGEMAEPGELERIREELEAETKP